MISDSSPRGGAAGWAAMIAVGGSLTFADTPATREREDSREALFALSRAGKMHIELRRERESMSLWRDIEVQPGQAITVDAPVLDSTLKGSMRTYDGGLSMSMHGWAGPRIQLISDDPEGWSVTDFLPNRDSRTGEEKDRFTMPNLPAGSYHLNQHLIGETKTYTFQGKEERYTAPIDAWGGISVGLESTKTTQLRDFIDYPYSDLRVRLMDVFGVPVNNATIRIRDRMAEAWKQVEENPAQLEQAAHPIPYPAAARVVQGAAVLPRIREGWLDFYVELDNGPIYTFTRPVLPSEVLTLTLPRYP